MMPAGVNCDCQDIYTRFSHTNHGTYILLDLVLVRKAGAVFGCFALRLLLTGAVSLAWATRWWCSGGQGSFWVSKSDLCEDSLSWIHSCEEYNATIKGIHGKESEDGGGGGKHRIHGEPQKLVSETSEANRRE